MRINQALGFPHNTPPRVSQDAAGITGSDGDSMDPNGRILPNSVETENPAGLLRGIGAMKRHAGAVDDLNIAVVSLCQRIRNLVPYDRLGPAPEAIVAGGRRMPAPLFFLKRNKCRHQVTRPSCIQWGRIVFDKGFLSP